MPHENLEKNRSSSRRPVSLPSRDALMQVLTCMRDAIHLACQPISQQCFSLIPNQYHSPVSSTFVSYQINISHQPQPSKQSEYQYLLIDITQLYLCCFTSFQYVYLLVDTMSIIIIILCNTPSVLKKCKSRFSRSQTLFILTNLYKNY